MTELRSIRHEFVEFIPERLEPGVVYVSIAYATTAHLCCCGCGGEVVNPLAPHGWKLTYDGRSISLSPSIGNWSFSCQSHYWIRNDRVDWAPAWDRDRIDAGRDRRRHEIDRTQEIGESALTLGRETRGPSGWRARWRRFLRRQ